MLQNLPEVIQFIKLSYAQTIDINFQTLRSSKYDISVFKTLNVPTDTSPCNTKSPAWALTFIVDQSFPYLLNKFNV